MGGGERERSDRMRAATTKHRQAHIHVHAQSAKRGGQQQAHAHRRGDQSEVNPGCIPMIESVM
jgi:hypothetical protein